MVRHWKPTGHCYFWSTPATFGVEQEGKWWALYKLCCYLNPWWLKNYFIPQLDQGQAQGCLWEPRTTSTEWPEAISGFPLHSLLHYAKAEMAERNKPGSMTQFSCVRQVFLLDWVGTARLFSWEVSSSQGRLALHRERVFLTSECVTPRLHQVFCHGSCIAAAKESYLQHGLKV